MLRSAIRTVANFEQALSSAAVIAKATEDQFISLRDAARDLGATTRFTATQAAEGLLFLSRAGFTVSESLTAIGPTLDLAQAGALDLGRAADIASNIMRGFRLEADRSSEAMDVLALVATSSNTNIQQLGDALKFVAPVAAGMGVELQETAAAVGALSNAGLQASLAGTGLRRVLSELESPAKKTQKILASLGLSTDDVRISQVGLTAALVKLRDAGVDTGQALELFGDRGGPAFEVLRSSIPDVISMTEELKNADGTARRIAEAMDDNLNGALLRVRSAYEAVILAFAQDGASNQLTATLNTIASALRFLAKNIEIVQGLMFGLTVAFIPKLIIALRALKVALLGTGFGAIAVVIGTAIGAFVAFKDQLIVSGNGITTLGDITQAVFERIAESVQVMVNTVGDLLGDEFLSDFEFTFGDIGTLIEEFVRGAAASMDAFLGVFVGARRGIEASFQDIPGTLLEITIAAVNGVIGMVEIGVDTVIAILQTLGDTILRAVKQFNNAFALLAAAGQSALAGQVDDAKRLAAEAEFQIANAVSNAISVVPQTMAKNFKTLSETDLIPTIENVADGSGRTFADNFLEGFGDGMEESTVFADSINDIFTRAEAIGALRESENKLAEARAAQGAGGAPTSGAGGAGGTGRPDPAELKSVEAGIKRGLATLEADITDFATLTEQTMVNAFGNAEDALVSFVQTGKFEFSTLIDSLLADLTRLLARQALMAILGAVGGGGGTGGNVANIATNLAARVHGGPVEPGQDILVGERGPELFRSSERGRIIPAGPTAAMMQPQAAPQVNVQVVNVTDPNEVVTALATPEGQEAILNVIRRNPRAIRETS